MNTYLRMHLVRLLLTLEFLKAIADGLFGKLGGLKQLSFKCSPLGVVATTTTTTTGKSHYNARQQPVEKYYNDVILLHCLAALNVF